jgi:hypothetical protein
MTAVCLTDSCLRDGTRAVRRQLATEQAGARLKEGKLEDERERLPRLVGFVQANEPRLLAFNEYASEEAPTWVLSRFTVTPNRWSFT